MAKRGQVAIFIILAVVIIAFAGLLIFLKPDIFYNKNLKALENEITKIDSSIEECVSQRGLDAVRIAGIQGGYIMLPDNYLKTNFSNIAYGYYNGKKTLVKKEVMEKEISDYISLTLPLCTGSLDYFNSNVSIREPTAKTIIENNKVSVSVTLPISAKNQDKSILLKKKYNKEIQIRLGSIYNIADEIIDKEIEDPEYIPLDYLVDSGYSIFILYKDLDNVVYGITDSEKSKINNVPYTFVFANKIKNSR